MYSIERKYYTKSQLLMLNNRVMCSLWRHFKWQLHSASVVWIRYITQLNRWHWGCLWLTLITDCHWQLGQHCWLTTSDHNMNLDFSDAKNEKEKRQNYSLLSKVFQFLVSPTLSFVLFWNIKELDIWMLKMGASKRPLQLKIVKNN